MRVALVHNEYGRVSGEEVAVDNQRDLLERRGHTIAEFRRSSRGIADSKLGKPSAFVSGIYSPSARSQFRRFLDDFQPDVVHVHNVYPLISPSVLLEARARGVPVVMTLHNYRLLCPNGLLLSKGAICERCVRGAAWWAVLKNCEQELAKSVGYAARSWIARKAKWFEGCVRRFLVTTDFQRTKFQEAGFDTSRFRVVPNFVESAEVDACEAEEGQGEYVAYLGRLSPEKGINVLLEIAKNCPEIPFRIVGSMERMPLIARTAPSNCSFSGALSRRDALRTVKGSRLLVFPSLCYEGFPLVALEAMLCARPVVASELGGLPEILGGNSGGVLCRPGDVGDFSRRIRELWGDREGARRLGRSGLEKAGREYSAERHYQRLLDVYREVVENGNRTP